MSTYIPWQLGKFVLSAPIATTVATSMSFTLATGALAPPALSAGQQTDAIIDNEIVTITAWTLLVSTYTATIVRAQGNTSAATHALNAIGYASHTIAQNAALISQTAPGGYLNGTIANAAFSAAGLAAILAVVVAASVGGDLSGSVGNAQVRSLGGGYVSIVGDGGVSGIIPSANNATALGAPDAAWSNTYSAIDTIAGANGSLVTISYMDSGMIDFGPGDGGVNWANLSSSELQPVTDGVLGVGDSTHRVTGVWSKGALACYVNSGDAFPNVSIQNNGGNGVLLFGPGGSTNFNAGIQWGGSGTLDFYNGSLSAWLDLNSAAFNIQSYGGFAIETVQAPSGATGNSWNTTTQQISILGSQGGNSTGAGVDGGSGQSLLFQTGKGGNSSTGTGGQSGQMQFNIGPPGTGDAGVFERYLWEFNGTTVESWGQSGLAYPFFAATFTGDGGVTNVIAPFNALTTIPYGAIRPTATLNANSTMLLPWQDGGEFKIDISSITFGAFSLTVTCGSGTAATTFTTATTQKVWHLYELASNTCVLQ